MDAPATDRPPSPPSTLTNQPRATRPPMRTGRRERGPGGFTAMQVHACRGTSGSSAMLGSDHDDLVAVVSCCQVSCPNIRSSRGDLLPPSRSLSPWTSFSLISLAISRRHGVDRVAHARSREAHTHAPSREVHARVTHTWARVQIERRIARSSACGKAKRGTPGQNTTTHHM